MAGRDFPPAEQEPPTITHIYHPTNNNNMNRSGKRSIDYLLSQGTKSASGIDTRVPPPGQTNCIGARVEGEGPVRLQKGGAIAERKRRLNREEASEQACMPELEEVSISDKATTSLTMSTPVYEKENANNARCQSEAKGWFEDDIEPAFLREEDYPAGWLVFDTVHGIISKEEADILHKKDLLKEKSILPEVKT
eukprot:scaffold27341_cov48-Attheya_sp.AAC.2